MAGGEIRIGRREKIEKRKGEKNREEKEKKNGKNKIRKKITLQAREKFNQVKFTKQKEAILQNVFKTASASPEKLFC